MTSLLQQRLGLLFGIAFWMYAVLFMGVFLAYQNLPAYEPPNASTQHAIAIGMFLILLIGWFTARSDRPLSAPLLSAIDWAFVVVTGPHFGIQTYLNADRITPPLLLLIYTILAAFGRAAIVPSTARRTAVLTGVAMLGWGIPAAIAVLTGMQRAPEFPPSMLIPFIVLLCIVVSGLATATSYVIDGLQTRLDETTSAGAYQLGRKLGESARGDVYEGKHAAHHNLLAVKVMRDVQPADARRLREVLAETSELDHPGIARIFDYGPATDGSFYYAMELIDGIDFETLVREHGAQPPERVIPLLMQLCDALYGAHCQGVVHRDLKPANIILCQRPGLREAVMVVDFGVVDPVNPDSQLTSPEVVEGTPGYMAPEAITDPADVGAQSDVYSFGAVAYFLLTGRTVFDGRTVAEMCAQHISNEPAPPSARAPDPLPEQLDELIVGCLAKKPEERPNMGDDIREALEALDIERWPHREEIDWWSKLRAARNTGDYSSSFSRTRALVPAGPSA